jgi:N-acetylglutamate synthase
MNVTIREMTLDDYDQVLTLWTGMEGIGLNESDSREAIERFLARNPGLSLVAEEDDSIIGAVLCGHDGRRGYLHHLAVSSLRRRQGLGMHLIRVCLDRLRVEGIGRCNIFLLAENTSGREFWKVAGYKARSDLLVMQRGTGNAQLPDPCRNC